MSPVSRTVKIATAGAVAATVAGFGATQALAASSPSPSSRSTTTPSASPSSGSGEGRGGPARHGGMGVDAAALATALGLQESAVQQALDSVRSTLRPSAPSEGTAPTEADRTARDKAMVTALAKALGVTEATVQSALDTIRSQHQADRRAELSDRLDDAVAAGTLTAADKNSVLKAFDAGVLGGKRG